MSNPRKQGSNGDLSEKSNGDDLEVSSSISGGDGDYAVGYGGDSGERSEIGMSERLTDVGVEQGDGGLLVQRSGSEDMVLQWLMALDVQVMGACRAEERLKPLLKLNAPSGIAEDRLLAHLSQHFEPSEVGMLARCFCIPLVSIRVGKINKQGTLLCPTATRGNLSLTLLPTSDLRLSFIGDDGNTERLFTLNSESQCSAVVLDEITADSSGRSFLVKIPDGGVFYFWCSDKSKLLGIELLAKMKDILKRKPSIAELTGISKLRLDCFATHLRAYLVGSNAGQSSSSPGTHWSNESANSALPVSLRSRHTGNEAAKASSPYQGSLSPRSNSFKEGLPKSLSSLKNVAKEKSRRRGEGYLSVVNDLMVALPHSEDAYRSDQLENEKLPDVPMEPSSFLASLGKLAVPLNGSQKSIFPSVSPPHYCLCPHGSSTLQFPSALPQLPVSTIESSLLPPLSSFLSSTLLTPTSPLSLADIPSLDFPALLPDPLVRLPIPSSQQILTFTPLMCDPIVHIPVIDVCSSGQGYLVSAGPAISSIIPPLHPKLVNPLVPDSADSLVEKGARETLRFLISSSSSQAGPQLMGVFPAAAVAMTDSGGGKQQSPLVAGSRGLYTGTADVNAIASMGLISFSESTVADGCTGLRNEVDYDLQDNSCGGGLSGDEFRPPFK